MPADSPAATPFACAYWPWRLAAASYACLVLSICLSLNAGSTYNALWQLPANLAFSASCLLGLTLLVAAALTAIAALRRPNIIDFVVLLVTLPPLALHIWGAVAQG